MDKVGQLIKLLHEGNEEVKYFLQALMVDPEINVKVDGENIYMHTPEDFDINLSNKIDDILTRNKEL